MIEKYTKYANQKKADVSESDKKIKRLERTYWSNARKLFVYDEISYITQDE